MSEFIVICGDVFNRTQIRSISVSEDNKVITIVYIDATELMYEEVEADEMQKVYKQIGVLQ